MKGAINARGKKNKHPEAEDLDIPPTQIVPEEDLDDMHGESPPISDDEVAQDQAQLEMPEQPDLGWYLSNWEISPKGKIAICRTFANYLSAQLPKQVEAKPSRYSGKKLKQ